MLHVRRASCRGLRNHAHARLLISSVTHGGMTRKCAIHVTSSFFNVRWTLAYSD